MTAFSSPTRVRFAAVGDLLLAPGPASIPYPRDPRLVSPELRALLAECDVVFGNLECTLPGDGRRVAAEPWVIGNPDLVRGVKSAGFSIVSLANNHTFDCFEPGYENLRSLLAELGIVHFGAGMNLEEASAPTVLDVNGLRLAFLAAVDERSGMLQFAAETRCGVPRLDLDRLTQQIRQLRGQADHVIVSLHWGEERFLIPSPVQIEQARALVDAGASIVLGHHPHVLQGLELWKGSPIAYSLGNFIADEVHFTDGGKNEWNRTGRTGCILFADLGKNAITNIRQVPTYDPGGLVELDSSGFGQRRIEQTHRAIARGVTLSRYRRQHLWVKTVKPVLAHLHWRRLKQLRPAKIRTALQSILSARKAR